ncbi:MAG: hypothetical protein BroJett030_32460 [Alphaproteobacteria bacterium]|nr:MAG: hypothetical protein BroJett030_32460 [Alphaproteobacteria bacterium]
MQQPCPAPTILLIEDNPGDIRLTEIALREGGGETEAGCQLAVATCLRDGVERLDRNGEAVDAVLLDIGLPDANGFDGLIAIRNANGDVPVIVLTGLSDHAVATEALRHGASDYLEKAEIRPKTLWRAIRYAIERKKSETELLRLANTDPLTGLLNRRAFFEQLEAALDQTRRSELACAVVVFDVDKLKDVNDLHGHAVGDSLLVEIARRVKAGLRRTDSIGRLGGDEFAIVAPNLRSANAAIEIAEKIRRTVDTIRVVAGVDLSPSVSIGIAVFPMDDSPADVLVSHADMALYKSKARRGGPINYYDQRMDRAAKARHVIKKNMLGDISGGRFYLEYQPIVDATSFALVGAEGLARWCDAAGKVIAPGEFIPIAEETGWISALGRNLLAGACGQIRSLLDDGIPTVPVSLNVSAAQCRDHSFALQLVNAVVEAGIEPRAINIEITESTLIRNVETTVRNLDLLKSVGIGIHIDDFGTGYSSLSLLKDLPLDALKIDRTFVADMTRDTGARQIVEAIAELSHKLHFRTIAEGVENDQQIGLLRRLGVDHLQGYRFSRPVRFEKFRDMLRSGAAAAAGSTTTARQQRSA